MTENDEKALEAHRKLRGKIRVENADVLDSYDKLAIYYTPGVGAVSQRIADRPEEAWDLTGINNTVAVISDGTAVLGLGNIGPQAALPVMEGKAMLFKEYGNINAFPIVLDTTDPKEIIETVVNLAPSFGGINLEDIAAPACFVVENELKKRLSIPVFHDDQHGTAIVVLAGLINAAEVVDKDIKSLKVVISGAGAAGSAIAKLLAGYGIPNILVLDSKGVISASQVGLRDDKAELAELTNPEQIEGDLTAALTRADVFIGVSKPALATSNDIKLMNEKAIVFALSNPVPEIMPDDARAGGAAVIATGRSDFPNQVNNALVFPALFRGALDNRVSQITDVHKRAAAEALANLITDPTAEEILPKIGDDRILEAIASVVR